MEYTLKNLDEALAQYVPLVYRRRTARPEQVREAMLKMFYSGTYREQDKEIIFKAYEQLYVTIGCLKFDKKD